MWTRWISLRLATLKYRIEQLVQAALATLPPDILPADIVRPVVDIERTRDAAHGDFATNVALQLAKPARRNPLELAHIFALGPTYGYNKRGAGQTTVIEFVSANPTGPLHVGHGRQAALGDA